MGLNWGFPIIISYLNVIIKILGRRLKSYSLSNDKEKVKKSNVVLEDKKNKNIIMSPEKPLVLNHSHFRIKRNIFIGNQVL